MCFEILKSLSKFSGIFRENFRKFWNYGFAGDSVAKPPETSEHRKKSSRKKSKENCKFLKPFVNLLANFDLKKIILIEIKANLMEF